MSTPISLRSLVRLQFTLVAAFVVLSLVGFGLIQLFAPGPIPLWASGDLDVLTTRFFFFIAIGFTAQLIDGAMGMAYGVTSTSLLLSSGIPPALASATVHAAEVVTTGVSGLSHWQFGNVRKRLLLRLALPGAVGAACGACLVASFDGSLMRPYVSAYLLIMGLLILWKALRKSRSIHRRKSTGLTALIGGFVDASGGGGWGPLVTSTLIGGGKDPRTTIGTVNAAEFLVAATASGVFSVFVGLSGWQVVLGLIMGGVLAAPLGAFVCHKINSRLCMSLVGLLIVALSLRNLGLLF